MNSCGTYFLSSWPNTTNSDLESTFGRLIPNLILHPQTGFLVDAFLAISEKERDRKV